jgi:hypothetical protein
MERSNRVGRSPGRMSEPPPTYDLRNFVLEYRPGLQPRSLMPYQRHVDAEEADDANQGEPGRSPPARSRRRPKVLRVLQERAFEPVGGCQTLASNARVVASRNRDLRAMVLDREFRVDIRYSLPPLPHGHGEATRPSRPRVARSARSHTRPFGDE